MPEPTSPTASLLIACPDRQGLVAAVTGFISDHQGNIINLNEHVDQDHDRFFMRIQWAVTEHTTAVDEMEKAFQGLASAYEMTFEFRDARPPRMGILVSKMSHCLYDMLGRTHSGEWNVEIPLIVSNHPNLEDAARRFDIPFYHVPVTKDTKVAQEAKQIEILKEHQVDFIVLARYMQILTEDFVKHFSRKIINIHHSFLPAFVGAKPYHQAYDRGVKIIGTTSHYVTSDLDAGPIIEQDIMRVSHKDSIKDLVRKGRDLERIVLARAIWLHLQNKTMVYNNKTVIFD